MLKRLLPALLVLTLPFTAWGQGTIAPSPVFVALDSNGDPLSSGKLCVYSAGTTTSATTYTSSALTVANTNPVIMNAAGRPNNGTGSIWLTPGQGYKFVLRSAGSDTTCATGTVQWTVDGISGVPTTSGNLDVLGTAGEALTAGQVVYLSDGSGALTAGSWYKADADLTYGSILPTIGIVPSSITSGTAGTIRLSGQATGLTSLAVGSSYYVSATAGALTATAPANRRLVGVADSTSTLVLVPALASQSVTSTITTTGTSTALALPVGTGTLTIFANNATVLTLQGIAAGIDGQELDLFSIGAGQVDLNNQHGSATAANRLINGVTGTISLAAGSGKVRLQYDGTAARWRVLQHEQGAWITPTFSAGDFTGNASMTWTVAAGDVGAMAYRLSGRTLSVVFRLVTTTVAGTPSSQLMISNAQWGGFTIAKTGVQPTLSNDNAGGIVPSIATLTAAGTSFAVYKSTAGAGNWAAATDATEIYGQLTFEVQ